MPENSLQDLRDDWEIGDEVNVEFPGYGSGTSSMRAGRIVDKESAFATVRFDSGGNQKIPYKRLKRIAKAPRPVPNPQPQQQSLPLLRAVPPALASLLAAPVPAPAPASVPPPAEEQALVKLAPRSTAARVVSDPEPELAVTPEPVTAPTQPKRKTDNIAAWLENGKVVLEQLTAKQKDLKAEHDEMVDLLREVQQEAALKQAALEAVEADIETYRKLRKFVSTVRPNIPLMQQA